MTTATLTPELTRLLDTARTLPDALVREVAVFAESLGHERADESVREHTIASLRRFEAEHAEEDWGEDLLNPGSSA